MVDHRGLPGGPKSDAHRDAIRASVKRTATYRRDFHAFFLLASADTADEAERRLQMIQVARRLVVNAPEDDRRWSHWLDLLEAGRVFRMKTYPLTKDPETNRV